MLKKKDIISQKRKELLDLETQSSQAINLVTTTISNLEKVNVQIDEKLEEIAEIKKNIQDTEDGLNQTRLNNTRIMNRFRELVYGA